MIKVDQRPTMGLLLLRVLWGVSTIVFSVTFWGASTPLFSVMVLKVLGGQYPFIQYDSFECLGGGSIPLIQCNGFWNSGEGLSENAATDQYNS